MHCLYYTAKAFVMCVMFRKPTSCCFKTLITIRFSVNRLERLGCSRSRLEGVDSDERLIHESGLARPWQSRNGGERAVAFRLQRASDPRQRWRRQQACAVPGVSTGASVPGRAGTLSRSCVRGSRAAGFPASLLLSCLHVTSRGGGGQLEVGIIYSFYKDNTSLWVPLGSGISRRQQERTQSWSSIEWGFAEG